MEKEENKGLNFLLLTVVIVLNIICLKLYFGWFISPVFKIAAISWAESFGLFLMIFLIKTFIVHQKNNIKELGKSSDLTDIIYLRIFFLIIGYFSSFLL